MSHNLRPYQAQGELEIFDAWRAKKKSIMFQLVTGGGKTVLFVNIIKKFIAAGKRVVLVAHREELIKQAWDTLYRGEIMAGIIKSGTPENYHLPCQVASIQTICRRTRLPKADLVIFDEAHHSQDDNSYGDVLLKHWPYARVLGVTATPYRLGGKGFTSLFDTLVQGPSFKRIVEMGYLVPFRYLVAYNPDLSKAKVQRGDYVADDTERAMQLAPIVESYLEHCKGMSGICFAINIGHSNRIVRQYIEAGIPAAHVDANTDINVRRKMFQDLKEKKILVLVNVGIATEGTDIPNIDFVQLARPTKSLSLYLQMVGRVTRPLWEAIRHGSTDEERRALIASSSKPSGIVLDNAGLYLDHGLPDTEFNWSRHFVGETKRDKSKPDTIEIIEFVAEDADGETIVTRLPEEVKGLKLIEVNYLEREKIINLTSLKEFDKYLEMFKRMPKINKAGYIAFRNYQDYCRKNSLFMSDEVWSYLQRRLVEDPAKERSSLSDALATSCQIISSTNPPASALPMIEQAKVLHKGRVDKIERASVALSFLNIERQKYFAENAKPQALQA
jgi:superfamily II DNA or RNA helicase